MIDTIQKVIYVRVANALEFELCSFNIMSEFINNSMLTLIIDRNSFYESESE